MGKTQCGYCHGKGKVEDYDGDRFICYGCNGTGEVCDKCRNNSDGCLCELEELRRVRDRAVDVIDAWQRDPNGAPVLLRERLKKLQAEIGLEAV